MKSLALFLLVIFVAALNASARASCVQSGDLVQNFPLCPAADQPFTFSLALDSNNATVTYTLSNASGVTVATGTSSNQATGIYIFQSPGLPAGQYAVSFTVSNVSYLTSYTSQFSIGGGTAPGLLSGQYTFLFEGNTAPGAPGSPTKAALVGSFNADGAGNVTSGIADVNTSNGAFQSVPLTGHYSYSQLTDFGTFVETQSINGSLVLETPLGKLVFYLGALTQGSPQSLILTAVMPAPVSGTGVLTKQDTSSFGMGDGVITTLNAHFTGETACAKACLHGGGQAVPVTATGSFRYEGGSSYSGELEFGFALYATVGVSGTPLFDAAGGYDAEDSHGRARLVFLSPGRGFDPPFDPTLSRNYVYYRIDTNHLNFMSLDPHAGFALISGTLSK